MSRRAGLLVGLTAAVLSLSLVAAAAEPAGTDSFVPYPLANGHFRYSRWDRTDHWDRYTASGEVRFTIEPDPNKVKWRTLEPTWQDFFATIGIVSRGPARACYRQDTPLMPGSYRFSVDVHPGQTALGKVLVNGKGKTVAGTNGWQRVSFEFGLRQGGAVAVGLWLESGDSGGTVKFRKPMIEILRLASTPVPLAGGGALGAVVIPADPDPAEEYAAYELQKYIHGMTGHVPGLKGRDTVFEGRVLVVGGSPPDRLKDLPDDAYAVDVVGGEITLRGKQPRGTLYAAYVFLKLQGCGWYLPGRWGEVVPRRDALVVPSQTRVESPDYDVRAIHVSPWRFDADNVGGWAPMDDYMDWAIRNRMNALWPQWGTMDLGRHRGTGHLQMTQHSWGRWRTDAHPEWWTLVNGQRMKLNETGRGNQLCVSSPGLRDQVVKDVLNHFEANPRHKLFGLNPDDAHVYWCECAPCRSLDEDEGKGEWHLRREREEFKDWAAWPELSMTDRVIDFVNAVAEDVSKVYPDKLIEVYAYGEFIQPPRRHKVHPNVLVKYCFQGRDAWPINKPVSEEVKWSNIYLGNVIDCLNGWQEAGARHMGLYDYYYYPRVECPMFSFYHVSNYTRTFHRRWGFRHYMGQTESSFLPAMMMFNLHARLLWDTDTPYKDVIREVCRAFYGLAAGTMIEYYLFMDEVIMTAAHPLPMGMEVGEFDLATVSRAEGLLERARGQAAGDRLVETRIDLARLGQANITYTLATDIKVGTVLSPAQHAAARAAFDLSKALRRKYNLTTGAGDASHLLNFSLPPPAEQASSQLP